jgi:hypothetical protein
MEIGLIVSVMDRFISKNFRAFSVSHEIHDNIETAALPQSECADRVLISGSFKYGVSSDKLAPLNPGSNDGRILCQLQFQLCDPQDYNSGCTLRRDDRIIALINLARTGLIELRDRD